MIPISHISLAALAIVLSLLSPVALATSPGTPARAHAPSRVIVINLKSPNGGPPPEGSIEITSLDLEYAGKDVWHGGGTEIPVYKGRAEFTLPAPNKLSIRSSAFPRHAIKPRILEIPAGADPLVIDLEVTPAGSVHVRLTTPDGRALSGWQLMYVNYDDMRERRRARGQKAPNPSLLNRHTDADGRLVITSLPLAMDFQLLAYQGSVTAPSPVVCLAADDPVRPLEWSIPEPELFSARVMTPDGSPAPDAQIQLTFRLKETHVGSDSSPRNFSFGFTPAFSTQTDARGDFSLPLNFEAPGNYELKFDIRKTWQPALIEIHRDTPRSGQTVQLAPGHVLVGRLLDATTRQPVPDVELFAIPDLASYMNARLPENIALPIFAETKTDAEGRFRFSSFPPGHFRLMGFAGLAEPAVVTLPAESDAPVELLLKR